MLLLALSAVCPLINYSLQVTTSIEHQATESSLCDRNTTAGLSTQGKVCFNIAENVQMPISSHVDDTFIPYLQPQWTVHP